MNTKTNETSTPILELVELVGVLWNSKLKIAVMTSIFAVASVIYALSLPNQYESQTLLQINENEQSNMLSGLSGQFGGLASVAGINLGNDSSFSNIVMETLKSRAFIINFINEYQVKVPLFAAREWDKQHKTLQYDDSVFDMQNQTWTREVKEGETPEPSDLEAYEAFMKIYSVEKDPLTGLVQIWVRFIDPALAKSWTEGLVKSLNKKLRKKEIEEKQKSIAYLTEKIGTIENSEIRNIFFALIEEQTKKMFLAEVQEEFALETIDPPMLAEKKAAPSRALICIVITTIGALLSILSILLIHYVSQLREQKRTNYSAM